MSTTPDERDKISPGDSSPNTPEDARGSKAGVLNGSDGDDLLDDVAKRFGFREKLRQRPALNVAYRIGVGVVGGLVLLLGIAAIPYPGPGWLIVFAGLAILATEFSWAERVLLFAKSYYDGWTAWMKRQHIMVRLLIMLLTAVVVLTMLWLLNVFGMVLGWVDLDVSWAETPIGFLK